MKWYRLYKESRKPSDEIRWNVINIQEAEIIGKKSEGKKSPGKITIKFALKGQSPYKNKTDTYLLQRAKYIIGEFQVDYKEPDSSFSSKEKVSDEISLLDFLNIGELIHFEIFRRSTKDLYMDFDELKEKVLSTITEEIEKLKGKSWVDDALDHWGGYSTDHTRD